MSTKKLVKTKCFFCGEDFETYGPTFCSKDCRMSARKVYKEEYVIASTYRKILENLRDIACLKEFVGEWSPDYAIFASRMRLILKSRKRSREKAIINLVSDYSDKKIASMVRV